MRQFYWKTVSWEHPWGKTYKPHAVCVRCRKQWKIRVDDFPGAPSVREIGPCPQCRGELALVGFGFAPPPRRDVRAWRAIESRLHRFRIG